MINFDIELVQLIDNILKSLMLVVIKIFCNSVKMYMEIQN